jgi:hypothetical protein
MTAAAGRAVCNDAMHFSPESLSLTQPIGYLPPSKKLKEKKKVQNAPEKCGI